MSIRSLMLASSQLAKTRLVRLNQSSVSARRDAWVLWLLLRVLDRRRDRNRVS